MPLQKPPSLSFYLPLPLSPLLSLLFIHKPIYSISAFAHTFSPPCHVHLNTMGVTSEAALMNWQSQWDICNMSRLLFHILFIILIPSRAFEICPQTKSKLAAVATRKLSFGNLGQICFHQSVVIVTCGKPSGESHTIYWNPFRRKLLLAVI